MNDLRIGVIGVGQRASLARLAHLPGAGSTVVACADPDPTGQAHARELFGDEVTAWRDYQDMLDSQRLDAVMIFTPDDRHTAPTLAALQAGVAAFVEKPLALSIEDCDQVLQCAHATGTRLYVGHNLRHLPALRAMRELIEQGSIGTVKAVWCRHFVGHGGDYYFKDWHADRRRTLSLLLQKAAHDLDVIHWLAGAPSRQVVAMGALSVYGNPGQRRDSFSPPGDRMPDWFDPSVWPPTTLTDLNPIVDVEDISMMLSQLANGVLASYQQCHFTPDYWRNYTVIGDEGRIENFGDAVSEGSATVKVWNRYRSGYREDADHVLDLAATASSAGHGGADAALVTEFLRFVRDGGPTETSPVAAREAVAAGVAATQSLRGGSRPVQISDLEPSLVSYFAAGQPAGNCSTTAGPP